MLKKLIVLSLFVINSAFAAGLDITVALTVGGSFQIKAPKIKGKVMKSGAMYKASKLWVKAQDLDSDLDLRNKHMLERLEAKKHRNIIVSDLKAKGGKGIGKITIKGITKKFSFGYKVSGGNMLAQFKLNLNDFKIKDLTYLGVGAKEIVTVKAMVPVK